MGYAMDRHDKAFDEICARFGVDPALMAAIIAVESSWKPYAMRFESGYRYTVKPAHYADIQGIGLVQIMGARARELGFAFPLPALFDTRLNVEYGCRCVSDIQRRWPARTDTIAAYNAGSPKKVGGEYENQAYVSKVLKALK